MADDRELRIEGATLRVGADMDGIDQGEFGRALDEFVGSAGGELVVDLGATAFLPSCHVPAIQDAAMRCRRDGRELTVRGRRNVIILLEKMGVGTVAKLDSE